MPRPGPKKVQRYSLEFKLKAVKLSQLKGVEVQAVADALEIHPFMLSRWRKQARDGVLRGRVSLAETVQTPASGEMKRFQALLRAHALLKEEHALLKKLIRFTSARKPTSSRSSTNNTKRSASRGFVGSSRSRGQGFTRGADGRRVRERGRTGLYSKRCVSSSRRAAGPTGAPAFIEP